MAQVNLVLLIELAAVVVGATAFLFYWNRLLASVLTFLVRIYSWRVLHAYVSIGSLQISPLAGRISFRDLEYHSSNISVRALNGHVTWRYWKFHVRSESDTRSTNRKRNHLPCRIVVYAKGVEAFVYNRTPAYDDIVERMKKHEKEANDEELRQTKSTESQDEGGLRSRLRNLGRMPTRDSPTKGIMNNDKESSDTSPTHELPAQIKPLKASSDSVNWFREALPLELRIIAGSIVLGSDATPTVLIGDFKKVEGTLETCDSRSILDQYKLAVELKFHEANVLTRTNVDYSGPLLAHGKKVYDELLKRQADLSRQPPSVISIFTGFHLLAKQFPFLYDPKFSTPPVPGLPTDKLWKGLARYRLPEDSDPTTRQKSTQEELEYAKVTHLLEAPELTLTYYSDTPGIVPDPLSAPFIDPLDEIGNVDLPPEYGIDITIHKGIIKYGPWADRQREQIQRAFAPALFFDSEPRPRLNQGESRLHTTLVLRIMLEDETTLRIPTRESSKNWQYDNASSNTERRYGWLDVAVGPNSSVVYTQEQIATSRGYESMLVLHLDQLAISSSVNLDTFIRSKTCKLSMAMPTPLRWNAQRDWGMDVAFDSPAISILRDHVTLISDLAKDWSSGTTGGDYHHFVPCHYNFRVSLINYAFHLYINDYNIVDAPGSRDSNAFMDVYGPRLDAVVAVASTQYRPESSVVPFNVSLSDALVELCVPIWDTHRTFGTDVYEIGRVGSLTASGSYRYYAVARPDHEENLTLHLEGKHVRFKALGWVLRRLFCVKDNYFGSFTQFTTMAEFLEKFDHDPATVGDPVEEKWRPGRSDPFAAHITMNIEESLIVMSDEIYNITSGIALPVPQLQLTIKSVDEFMELALNATPTYIVAAPSLIDIYRKGSAPLLADDQVVFLEGMELKAIRLFGPQPRATTYLCLWEANITSVTAFLTGDFISTLQAVGSAVGYTFSDPENSPDQNYQLKTPPDVTFFKLCVEKALVMLTEGDHSISIDIPRGLLLDTSTWGTRSHSSNTSMLMPSLTANLLSRGPGSQWQVVSNACLGMTLDIYNAPERWQEHVEAQQRFLRDQDTATGRIWFLYQGGKPQKRRFVNGLYLPLPLKKISDALANDSESTHSLIDHHQGNRRSSSGDSDSSDEMQSPTILLMKRTKAKFAGGSIPGGANGPSDGDESDIVSSSTSTEASRISVSPNSRVDMADGLEIRLRHYRLAHSQHIHSQWLPLIDGSGSRDQKDHPRSEGGLANGKVIRIGFNTIVGNIKPEALPAVAKINSMLSHRDDSYEKRLDRLLVNQYDKIEDAKSSEHPTVYDIRIPAFQVCVAGPDVSASTVVKIDNTKVDIHSDSPQRDLSPTHKSVLNLRVSVSSATITSYASAEECPLSLVDVNDMAAGIPGSCSIAHVSLGNLKGSLYQSSRIRLQGTISHARLYIVTSFVPFAMAYADFWESSVKQASLFAPEAALDSEMLFHILSSAVDSGRGAYLPSFAYVAPYGLHEQDSQLGNRRQTGWWLLARFREWLRSGPLNGTFDRHDLPTRTSYVLAELLQYDDSLQGASQIVEAQPFFHLAFMKPSRTDANSGQRDKSTDVSLYVEELVMRHHGRSLGSRTEFTSLIMINKSSVGYSVMSASSEKTSCQARLMAAIQSVNLQIHDSVLALANQAVHTLAERLNGPKASTDLLQSEPVGTTAMAVSVQIAGASANVVGGNLRLHLGAHNFLVNGVSRSKAGTTRSNKESLTASLDNLDVALLQPHETIEARPVDRIVLSLRTTGWASSLQRFTSSDQIAKVRLMVGLKALEFDSRPQLRALYFFVQEWKAQELPLYASSIEDMREVLKDHKSSSSHHQEPIVLSELDITVQRLQVQVRAARALWVRWDIGKVYASRVAASETIRFAFKAAPQVVGAYASRKSKSSDATALHLPSVTATGVWRLLEDKPHVSADVQVGLFTGVLRPAMLDRLLSLHQKLGEDLRELVDAWQHDVAKVRDKLRGKHPGAPSPAPTAMRDIIFNLNVGVAGLRFGLRAEDVPATVMFEALAIIGTANNQHHPGKGLQWSAQVNHFSLSLGHPYEKGSLQNSLPISRPCTASMTLDVRVEEIPETPTSALHLKISLSQVRTVMHVEALNELIDLFKSWSSDLYILREHRAEEMAEVKEQTTKVLKKLESVDSAGRSESSWLASRLLTVKIEGVGIAIPLVQSAQIPSGGVPALLFSIRNISYENKHNAIARFRMQTMALQFVKQFDQGKTDHYTHDAHGTKNCMVLPAIESEAQMSTSHDQWRLSAHCSATDFKLVLSPDVSDGILELVNLFEQGKERISTAETHYKTEMAKHAQESLTTKYDDHLSPKPVPRSQLILVRMSFTFNSGVVELHREPSDTERQTMDGETRRGGKGWHDVVILPTVSMWVEYNGPAQDEEGLLLFNLAVHESRNLLRPTILPFFVQTVNRMARRQGSSVPSLSVSKTSDPVPAVQAPKRTATNVRVTLRIDKSELRLSCAPDSNSYVDLKWESGGFFASFTPGTKGHTTVAGSISGVTSYLKHEFAEGRSCIEAGAKDIGFSVTSGALGDQSFLSVALDSQISAQFRLEQFSAWLAFAAVWIDNTPEIQRPARPIVESSPSTLPNSTVISTLVRFRAVDFDANIGVTKAKLNISPIVIRAVSNGVKTDLCFSLGVTHVIARGDISGEIRSESLSLKTTRQSSRSGVVNDPTVLSMSIDAGHLSGDLSLQELGVISFTLDPATVTLADDWKAFTQDGMAPVILSFAVKAGTFRSVVRLLAIPALLNKFYSVSNTIDSQERIASHRSNTYKLGQARKSTEPTPMAAAILKTARRAGQSLSTDNTVNTAQNMRFDLGGVDIGLFNAPPSENQRGDFYRFMIGKVEADLERQVTTEGMPKRDLNLLVSYLEWVSSDGVKAAKEVKKDRPLKETIHAASAYHRKEIASLPLMTMTMDSVEVPKPLAIVYDFDLVWGEGDLDISIMPYFFEQVYKTFDTLIKGLDQEQLTRARRRGDGDVKDKGAAPEEQLAFRRRIEGQRPLPIPRLKLLGEATGEAMTWVPKITAANERLPVMVHRFVTLPLEEGMDLLLRLYEKQLPDKAK
ncbi:hypothetical protein L202_05394 [Cryptococcus amylolentus CBS 6039]|uniref:Csf1 N-terminal domain-containing protein n=1 Tax=Cryptococcus amylolentus CBS 6039 TaxID=1295533 RepID=A0A1E3HKB8_9TREE|nr:hypothetical protein L202_05394 [Cryptococcus amylolentus CBS 6039]ODN76792.1 hypothetical protein L202_05394 [Cryptococcus amylolentus CBS 6039]